MIIALTGGLADSPPLIAGTPFTLALVLLAIGYMGAPALAHILTRLITREGWRETGLRPRLKQGWRYWLAAWLLPAPLTILGAVGHTGDVAIRVDVPAAEVVVPLDRVQPLDTEEVLVDMDAAPLTMS